MSLSSAIICDHVVIERVCTAGLCGPPFRDPLLGVLFARSALGFLFGRALWPRSLAALRVGAASAPGISSRAARKKESAVKPGSVVDSHSSGIRVTAQLKRPTRKPMWATCSGRKAARFPIWSCSRWGLPCRWCCHPRGALLPHHFTLTGAACAALRRYLSVALSVGSRLPGVTWHRALWSPDFPPSLPGKDSDCLADSCAHHTQVRALMRGRLLFEEKRALVGLIVAGAGDLGRKARGLLQRQLSEQRNQHFVQLRLRLGIFLSGLRLRCAADEQNNFAARKIGVCSGFLQERLQRAAVGRLVQLGRFAHRRCRARCAECPHAILQRLAHSPPPRVAQQRP